MLGFWLGIRLGTRSRLPQMIPSTLDRPEEPFARASNGWDIQKLYTDLANAKQEFAPHTRRVSFTLMAGDAYDRTSPVQIFSPLMSQGGSRSTG
ncbi:MULTISPECIES: hypothetical protein [unclassified Microcoleus]|uniref:hypothetical protein n=1 Tax=unclassified Microcoleus TaxID=2642155 RepID=UPI002FD5891B